jgi:hypothetical protein
MRIPLVVVAVLVATTLAGCGPTPPAPVETTPIAAEETPVDTPTPMPEAPVTPSLSDDDLTNIAESISSGNTAALEGYLSDDPHVIIAASECCMGETVVEALNDLAYVNNATGPWTFPTDPADVAAFQSGFYAQYFPDGAYVGNSSDDDPFIVSFTIEGDQITTIFVSAGSSLLTE